MKNESLVSRTLLVCGIVVAVASIALLIFVAKNLLPLIFGSVLIAVVLNRCAEKSGKLLPDSLSRQVRVGIVITTLTILSCIAVYAFADSASEQVVRLTDRVEASVERVLRAAKDQPVIQRYLDGDAKVSSILPSSAKSLGLAKNFFTTTFGALADILILIILSAYFAFSPTKYRGGASKLLPRAWRDPFRQLLDESGETLWRWMLGRLLAMSLVGILFGIGLAIIGIPMPVELGIFAASVTFIPNIGGLAAVIPAMLLASQQGSAAVASVVTLYLVIQFVESYLITPMVQEHQVALPPAVVILAQILAGLLFGFWGIVFATPLVAVASLWTKRLYVERLLGSEV